MKKFSHSIVMKFIVFVIGVLCISGALQTFVNEEDFNQETLASIVEDDYLESESFVNEQESIIWDLIFLLSNYKSEEHIVSGGTISDEQWFWRAVDLLTAKGETIKFNPDLSDKENIAILKEKYPKEVDQAREFLINDELRGYERLLDNLQTYEGVIYYATDGNNIFSNTDKKQKEQFETYPAYFAFEKYQYDVYPKEIENHRHIYYTIREEISPVDLENTEIYLAFSEQYVNEHAAVWQDKKESVEKSLAKIASFVIGFLLSFIYLVFVIGRKSFKDENVHFHAGEKIYNDIGILLAAVVITLYAALIDSSLIDLSIENIRKIIVPILLPIIVLSLSIILTLIKHIKNKTLFKHTLIYSLIHKLVRFIGEVYRSGNVGMKTVLIVVGYPLLVALTFFMFPVTIGVAAWFALKKITSFQKIQEGVEKIKGGDLHHRIVIEQDGEFKTLAENINTITDGLNKAMENELKSERLKTELITNVSHDIRTPLTSIITYVDLLKNEEDPAKIKEYVEVLDQKSKRLKTLTDDLFEAAKASSGNIPVHLEKIDVVSLINQGLGEVSDKMEEMELHFRLDVPDEKVHVTADGKLLWRSFENLLSNIFKYSLKGSRVYITVEDLGEECLVTFKNISATELNISADELMERFKRGDESRTTPGSGLGLSIAKSLIELQKGKFEIEIDGDLFKVFVYLPKHM